VILYSVYAVTIHVLVDRLFLDEQGLTLPCYLSPGMLEYFRYSEESFLLQFKCSYGDHLPFLKPWQSPEVPT
jgi:hypothetical protein